MTVTATLSTVSGLDVTVPYAVSGTAANPEDHDLANGSVVILAGNLNGSVAFNVVNDVMSEVDETVIVTMGAPTNATLGATTVHTVTITDDDAGPGMVLHYEFDDVADGTAVDTSGNANDGAVTPPDTRPAGRIGQALDLDGSTTKVTSANPMGITGSAARTVVFWANPTTAPQCAVVGWGAQIIDQLFMTSINNGSWYLQARGGSGDWDTGIAVQTGVWTHHAITYDGTTVKWYVDSGAPVSSPAHVYATADGVLQIGKHPDLPPYYDGLLDDVRVYDIALTPAEIDGLYQAVVTRWYVDSTAGSGGDGTSWATAFEYVQDGLAAAVAGHEIWVAAGTYTNNAGGTATVLVMVDGVSIYGGFAGTEDLRSERDPVANVTTLDGENTAYHVVEGASNATLDGFTVTRGNASGASPDDKGAGLYCFGQSDLAVAGCRFTSCTGSGTIVHFENCSSVSCSTSSVDNNSVAARTMYIRLSDLVVIDSCRFFNNSINYSSALDVGDCSPVVRNCVFWGNTSPGTSGNGIYATGAISVPLLSNCVFAYNNNYGVLAAYGATVTLRNCIVWGNTSGSIYTFSGGELGFVDATYCDIAGGYVGGNIDADPLFVDPDGPDAIPGTADDDFRLSAGSPCIDAADGDAAPAADLDGNPRSDDTGTPDTGVGAITYADMGAYEFQGTTPPPVAPYTPDANTVLLDHFDGTIDPSGTIEAFSYTGVSNPEPPAVPNYAWVGGPNGLGQALELLPPIA